MSGDPWGRRPDQGDLDPDEKGADRSEGLVDGLAGTVEETLAAAGHAIARAGREIVPEAVETLSAARGVLGRAGRAIGDSQARRRRIQRQAKRPLPLLYDVHPEARRALPHPVGVRTIPIAEIAGSAVEPPQRGGDFLPLPAFRSNNWRARWQRLRAANERLANFPPIDVLRFGDHSWVTDGHNRVALGLYEGQVGIDANVTELHLPGQPVGPSGELAPLLEETRQAGPASFPTGVSAADRPRDDAADGVAGESDGEERPSGDPAQ